MERLIFSNDFAHFEPHLVRCQRESCVRGSLIQNGDRFFQYFRGLGRVSAYLTYCIANEHIYYMPIRVTSARTTHTVTSEVPHAQSLVKNQHCWEAGCAILGTIRREWRIIIGRTTTTDRAQSRAGRVPDLEGKELSKRQALTGPHRCRPASPGTAPR